MIASTLLHKLTLKAESLLDDPHNIVEVSIIDRKTNSFLYNHRVFCDDYSSQINDALLIYAALISIKQTTSADGKFGILASELIEKRKLNINDTELYLEVKSSYGITESQVNGSSLQQIFTLEH